MPAITYPAGLPMPSVATLTPTERRDVSSLPGPRSSRVRQRDFNATQQIEWAVLTRSELAELRTWWHDVLVEGGAWFAATWPLPEGLVVGVRKFLAEPQRTYLGNNRWRVSAQCEVRGRGMSPQGPAAGVPVIGWADPITDAFGSVAHGNAGTGVVFGAFGIGPRIYARFVDDPGGEAEWVADWTPTAGGPQPVLTWDPDLRVLEILWLTQTDPAEDDPFLINPARGQLIVGASLDGVYVPVGERIVVVVSSGVDYPEIAWGPEP